MTAPDSVLGFLAERGPAPTSEIAQALSEKYGYSTVRAAILDLKKKGAVVDTGERPSHGRGRPEHIVALERELERASARREVEQNIRDAFERVNQSPVEPTIIQRVKRWFGVK